MRLNKAVTAAGLTRTQAKDAIKRGRVSVNASCEKDCARQVSTSDEVRLDGECLDLSPHRHIMLNKPAGVITATEDARGDVTVLDLIPPKMRFKGLGPVGRLDRDVTGLVILTTDGELAHRLISPKRGIEKRYCATARGRIGEAEARAFESGIKLSDFTAKPARLEIVSASDESSVCRVYVSEGKFHQVKRMFLAVGHEITALRREAIAGLELDKTLDEGKCRYLTPSEAAHLYEKAGLETE